MSDAFRKFGTLFLMGIPGIGKSTMVHLVGKEVNLPAVDAEDLFLSQLAQQHRLPFKGFGFWDRELGYEQVTTLALKFLFDNLPKWTHRLVVVSSRHTHRQPFWDCARERGLTLALKAPSVAVYHRRMARKETFENQQLLNDGRASFHTEEWYRSDLKIFLSWDQWRQAAYHQRAQYSVWVRGNLEQDVASVATKIRAIRGYTLAGGTPPNPSHERGWGFHPNAEKAADIKQYFEEELPPLVQDSAKLRRWMNQLPKSTEKMASPA